METFNLADYDLIELRCLQYRVEREIRNRTNDNVQKARAQIFAIARKARIPIDATLIGNMQNPAKTRGEKTLARYQNPRDISQKWIGRGRRPRWLVNEIANGRSLDDFRISNFDRSK
jgi:DNA-binding protein H-NS